MLVYISEEDAKHFVELADKSEFGASEPIKKLVDAISEQL